MNTSDFDPEANPELKDPPDPSEFSIRRKYKEILEMIRDLELLIRNDISLIEGKNIGLPDD